MNRSEHIEWCKQRALEYLHANNPNQAFASMMSDLRKHEETSKHPGIELGMLLLMSGTLSSIDEMRKFIEGFH